MQQVVTTPSLLTNPANAIGIDIRKNGCLNITIQLALGRSLPLNLTTRFFISYICVYMYFLYYCLYHIRCTGESTMVQEVSIDTP